MSKALVMMIGSAAALAGCSGPVAPETRSPKALAALNEALAGKTAQPAVNCLPVGTQIDMQVIDERAIVYRAGRTAYLQELRGGCSGLGRPGAALVTEGFGGGRLCNGDFARVVDLSTGINYGNCAMGPFIPYKPAG